MLCQVCPTDGQYWTSAVSDSHVVTVCKFVEANLLPELVLDAHLHCICAMTDLLNPEAASFETFYDHCIGRMVANVDHTILAISRRVTEVGTSFFA